MTKGTRREKKNFLRGLVMLTANAATSSIAETYVVNIWY